MSKEMNIEEAIEFLKHVKESQKDLEDNKTTKFYKKENEAIETVLADREKLIEENKNLKQSHIGQLKQIDLITKGDYVNGKEVIEVRKQNEKNIFNDQLCTTKLYKS